MLDAREMGGMRRAGTWCPEECSFELDSNSAERLVSRQACVCPGCFVLSSFFLWLFILVVSKARANNGDMIKGEPKNTLKRGKRQ